MSLRKILFTGKHLSGKGTQAKILVERHGFSHLSTGELIREGFNRQDPIVMPYQESVQVEGTLLPDKEVFELIERGMRQFRSSTNYVLDGAIRTLAQAERGLKMGLYHEVVDFNLSDEEVRIRAAKRYELEGRLEDAPETVEKRLGVYRVETEPLASYFLSKNIFVHMINASPSNNMPESIEMVHEEIVSRLRL